MDGLPLAVKVTGNSLDQVYKINVPELCLILECIQIKQNCVAHSNGVDY